MAKKILFVLLVLSIIVIGAVVSMATEEELLLQNVSAKAEKTYIEKYSSEEVLEKYSSLFFDKDIQSESVLVGVNFSKNNTSKELEDYYVTGQISQDVKLETNDTMVLMVFIQKNNEFVLLANPMEGRLLFYEQVKLPFIGEDNPNQIRIIAFPKNSYKNLQLDKNVQITDIVVTVQRTTFLERVKDSLLNVTDSLRQLVRVQ